jgi:hypothetical protein
MQNNIVPTVGGWAAGELKASGVIHVKTILKY